MAQNTQTFILVGDFKDNITPKLRRLNRELTKFSKDLNKSLKGATKGIEEDFEKFSKKAEKNFKGIGKGFDKAISDAGRSVGKLENSLNDAGRAAGKARDTVSQIGEGLKGFDGLSESMEGVARAAGRAQDEVLGIGEAASRANRQADDLMSTLLKAEGLSRFGDAMSQGFGNSMNAIVGTAQKGAGLVGRAFKDAMEDELADIKAASGIQGSFGMAGFKGDFTESQKMYKKYDQVVSEMIRQSSAPTAKVVELQRYTLDTMGPLMLAAQGVKKGTAMKDIDPQKIEASAKQYGAFLEKAALFSQGTGSAGFRVAAGIEQLVTRGKIDTTIDFFTDNIMLMKNLEDAGFMGRGRGTSKLMNATDAKRMAAMMEAFNKSMSSESTAAMAQSLTGSLQGLQDTLFNPSVGILGMAVTFTKDEQKATNASIKKIMDARIKGYQNELKNVKISEKRREELNNSIAQVTATRDKLLKEDTINTPFKAFSFAFTRLIQGLTNVINAIGPVWTEFSIAMVAVTDRVFAPLTETLQNVASDLRGGKYTQMEGFGRIVGEIFKTIGQIFADLAKMLTDPNSAMGKAQSEFMKGFMDAFKEPGSLEKAKKGLSDGITALVQKVFSVLMSIITADAMRPIVIPFLALMFGPPLISAVIAGATPLIINAILGMFTGIGAKAAPAAAAAVAAGRGGGLLRGIGGAVAGNFDKLGAAAPGAVGKAASAVKMKGIGAAAAAIVTTSVTLAKAAPVLGKVGKAFVGIGKRLPLLSIGFAGLDFAMRKDTEGVAKAGGGALGGLAGGAVGAAIGTAILPGIGTAVGGVLGTVLGDKLGTSLGGLLTTTTAKQDEAAKLQMSAAALQQKAAAEKFRQIGLEGLATPGVADPSKLGLTLKALGLEGDKTAQAYAAATRETKAAADNAAAAKDKLFGLVENLKAMGYTNQQIWSQADVQEAKANYESLQKKAGEAAKKMDETFKAMPQTTSRAIMTAMSKMSTAQIEAAIAQRINLMKPPQMNWTGQQYGPGGLSNMFAPPVKTNKPPDKNKPHQLFSFAKGSANPFKGSLSEAINYEMKNKPKGSDLVIANSSETIIPAADGLGSIKEFLSKAINYEMKNKPKESDFIVANFGEKAIPPADGISGMRESLSKAINYEMKNKPKGSDLVIANSSETVIPAADGLGSMKGVIDAIWRSGAQVAATTIKGFDQLRATIVTGDAKNAAATSRAGSLTKSAIDRSIAVSMAGDAKIMSAIKAASAAGGLGGGFGGALGGASGNLQAAAAMAKSMGLTMTSYKRNGPPNASYHNVGRAMDFSNSTGPTPQMLKFAQGMAAKYGSSMAELIYTPLNFSIKNGKKVAPYAQGSHYNHVHVAFANGLNNPTIFSSAAAAAHYEKMMAPAGAKVATVTANSSEYGNVGHTTVNQSITISGAQDPKRLAEMVFEYASRAAQRVNNASFA